MSGKTPTARLDRLLANLGYGSRREIQMLARNGHILMDGAPFQAADTRIALTPDLEDRLIVDGERLDPLPGVVLAMHKPLGVTCSHKEAGPLVYASCPRGGAGVIRPCPPSGGWTRKPPDCFS